MDGLRAISFLLVYVAHAGLEQVVPGGFGVTIFFFLSGYLITTLMRAEYEKNGRVSLRHFWLRRVLRILPPFYLVLGVTAVIALIFDPPGTLTVPAVAAQALHYTNYWLINHGYAGQPAGTGVYWSLAVEEHFYLLFPLIYIAMRKFEFTGRTQAILLWSLCGVVLLWRVYLVMGVGVATDRTYMGSDTRVDSILFGCALAVWNNPVLDPTSRKEGFWKFVVFPVSILLLAFCLLYRAEAFRETARYTLQGVALTGLFVVCIRCSDWIVFKPINAPFLSFIGVLSYSLYLVHFAVILAVARLFESWHPLLQALLSLSTSVCLAWTIYKYVEKPCARLRRRLSD
ncbi:MAG: acyltransferase family protein [Steroidobacteraceae bacterium]